MRTHSWPYFFVTLVFALTASLTACSASSTADSLTGIVVKQPSYSEWSALGSPRMQEKLGDLDEGHYDRYCEGAIEDFGLAGMDVTIRDAGGNIVGVTELAFDADQTTRPTPGQLWCAWTFTIDNFTSDSEYFTVDIEGFNSGDNVTRDELLAGLRYERVS